MRDIIGTKFTIFLASLEVADEPTYAALWQDRPPLAFSEAMALIRPLIAALRTKGVYELDLGTCPERLRQLRDDLESRLHLLARAAFRCLINRGRPEDAKLVDVKASVLAKARPIALVEWGEAILETAEPLFLDTPPLAAKYFTHEQFDQADQLWQKYTVILGAPPSARGKRKGLNTGLLGDLRALEVLFATCDDLILQFAIDSETGARFVAEWFGRRQWEHVRPQLVQPIFKTNGRIEEEAEAFAAD